LSTATWRAEINVVKVNTDLREMTVGMWLINMPKEGEKISVVEPSGSANIVSA
jgi:hypothetical protein